MSVFKYKRRIYYKKKADETSEYEKTVQLPSPLRLELDDD
jgi:hypothetical protein